MSAVICCHDVPSGDPKRPRLIYSHTVLDGGVVKELAILATRGRASFEAAMASAFQRAGGVLPVEFIDAPETCPFCQPSPDGDGYIGEPAPQPPKK